MDIATIIRQQLGGVRFEVMTGARKFGTTGNDLSFQIGRFAGVKVRYVKIKLELDDTYTMTFYDAKAKVLNVRSSVHADDLQSVFSSETGLALNI